MNRADGGAVFLGYEGRDVPLDSTFAGGVELRSGQLFLQRASALGSGPLTVRGGTVGVGRLRASGFGPPLAFANAVILQADLHWVGQEAAVLSGPVTGAGGLRVDLGAPIFGSSRTLSLQGAASFTGSTRVENVNTLSVGGAGGALTATSAVTVLPGATLEIDHRGDGAAALDRLGNAVPVTLHAGSLSVLGSAQGPVVEAMGALSGGSGLGSVRLAGAAGAATDPAVILVPASFAPAPGAVVRFSGRQLGGAVPGAAGVDSVVFADAAGTLAQLIGGSGAAGTPTLSILPGALGVLPAGQRDPAAPTGTSFVTYDPVRGVRPLRPDTEYRRTLADGTVSSDNVFLTAQSITINADTTVNSLLFAGGGGIRGGGTLRVTSGMVAGGGFLEMARLDFGAQPGRVIVDTNLFEATFSGTLSISSAIGGSAGVTFLGEVTGGARIILSGVNTFTGPLIIAAVVEARAGARALGGTGPVQLDGGGTLILGDTLQRDLLVGEGNGSLMGATLAGRLLGAGRLSLSNGAVTLAGADGDFTGRISVASQAELRFSNGNQLGTPREIALGGGGRLTNTAATTLNAPLRLTSEFSGGNATIETRADLTLGQGLGGNVTAYGYTQPALIKAGAGTLRVQGDSAFAGAVTVQEGTLIVNGSFARRDLPGVGLTVAAGARLGGNGLLHRDVSLAGRVAPGDFAPGILTLDGDLAVSAGAAFEWDRSGTGADLLAVSGQVTFSGGAFTLRLRALDGARPGGADVLLQTGEGFAGTTPNFLLDFTDAPAWAALGLRAEIIGNSLVLVPEPGTVAAMLILGGGALLLARARRAKPAR